METTCNRFTRSSDRMIAGVCGGIAEHYGYDVSLVRAAALAALFFGGFAFWAYVLLWIITPPRVLKRIKE